MALLSFLRHGSSAQYPVFHDGDNLFWENSVPRRAVTAIKNSGAEGKGPKSVELFHGPTDCRGNGDLYFLNMAS